MSLTPSKTPAEGQGGVNLQEIMEQREKNDSSTDDDCPICMEKYLHPVKLPCGHIFCFLCCKGEGLKRNRCAICRSDIPNDFFYKPTLVDSNSDKEFKLLDGYQWFYEGRDGWWQYDERSSIEIEDCFVKGDSSKEILIAGHLYVIDFRAMRQHRRNRPGRFRRIKRDLCTVPKKGVAGLKLNSSLNNQSHRDGGDGDGTETPSSSATPNVGQNDEGSSETADNANASAVPGSRNDTPRSDVSDESYLSIDSSLSTDMHDEEFVDARQSSTVQHSAIVNRPQTPPLQPEILSNHPLASNRQVLSLQNTNSSIPINDERVQKSDLERGPTVAFGNNNITDQSGHNCTANATENSGSIEPLEVTPRTSLAPGHSQNKALRKNRSEGQGLSDDLDISTSFVRTGNRGGGRVLPEDNAVSQSFANMSLEDPTGSSEQGIRGVRRRQRTRADNINPRGK